MEEVLLEILSELKKMNSRTEISIIHRSTLTAEKLIEKYSFTMTPEQLAEVLGLAKDTVLRKLQKGEIRAYKSGSRWIIATETVAEYLIRLGNAEHSITTKQQKKRLIE